MAVSGMAVPSTASIAKWLPRNLTANNPPSPKNRLPTSLKLRWTGRRTGRAFWKKKLAGNKTRDRLVNRALRRAGWRVLRIWECELTRKNEARLVQRIQRASGVTSNRWQVTGDMKRIGQTAKYTNHTDGISEKASRVVGVFSGSEFLEVKVVAADAKVFNDVSDDAAGHVARMPRKRDEAVGTKGI
jgi:hypothetical protein